MKTVVIGAYGYTGQLICQELDKRGFSYAVAGRDEAKLIALRNQLKKVEASYFGDLSNASFATQIIQKNALIINCAGPFTEESTDFLARVAQSGKTYLDISGELEFAKEAFENLNTIAQKSGALIMMGCAFESLLVDLAAQASIAGKKVVEINSYYGFNKHIVSPGTRITMKLSKFRNTLKINQSVWAKSDLFKDRSAVWLNEQENPQIAIPYPLPEVVFFKWTLNPVKASSFILLPEDEAKYLEQRDTNKKSLEETYARLKRVKKQGPEENERASQECKILLEIKFDDATEKHLVIENKDMYLTTAQAIVLTVEKIAKSAFKFSGVINPAQLFKGTELDALKSLGCKVLTNEKVQINPC